MTTAAAPRTWMTLADVARLAQVQRPVVSTWRTRHASFPPPAGQRAGHPVFDAEQVGRWLQDTGLGNNPDALGDALAFAPPGEDVARDTLAALLTLAAVTGEQLSGLGVAAAQALAREVDPDDQVLRREVDALPPDADATLAYADGLADAAYSPAGALDLLRDRRLRDDPGPDRHVAVAPELSALVGTLVRTLAVALDLTPLTLVDATRGGSDLVVATAAGAEEALTVGLAAGTEARGARQRLWAHGIPLARCETDDGLPVPGGPCLVLTQLPDGPRPQLSDAQILHEVGELTLRMSDRQWALVIAPASALTDRLRDPAAERDRDDILRAGRLRLALRLPKGLLRHGGRRQLALWLLGGAHPDVPAAQRWTVVGDLTDVPLDAAVRDEIATDAVAALSDAQVVRGHAFRHARLVSAPGLVATRGALVTPAGSSPHRPTTPGEVVLRIEDLQQRAGCEAGELRPADGDATAAVITLGRAVESRLVRLMPGHRIRESDVQPGDPDAMTGVVVLGPDELIGARRWGARRIDRLRLHTTYPSAQLTEPGDVVFSTAQRVSARVDRRGGCVVCAPARVLRITGRSPARGSLVPGVLAADLAAQPVAAKAYRSWTVRLVPTEQRDVLTDRLDELETRRDDLRRRLEALDALQQTLTDGVAAGAVTLAHIRHNDRTDQGE